MKRIELFERAIAEKARNLKDYGINSTMFWAYRKSMEAGNDSIDFGEVIWDEDIEAITAVSYTHLWGLDRRHRRGLRCN